MKHFNLLSVLRSGMLLLLLWVLPLRSVAQIDDDMWRQFDDFRRSMRQQYGSFADSINRGYADFMRQAWANFAVAPPQPKPIEKPLPPVIIKDEDRATPVDDRPVEVAVVVHIPEPTPPPQPIAPVEVSTAQTEHPFHFMLYGVDLQIPLSDHLRFGIGTLNEANLATAWQHLSGKDYQNLLHSCLSLRNERHLCDWSYLQMLDALSAAYLGCGTNEATLLMAFLFCQSGYKMRLAMADGVLVMLYGSQHTIFGKQYLTVDGMRYYCYSDKPYTQLKVCKATYPKEQALSLHVGREQLLGGKQSPQRALVSSDRQWLSTTVAVDESVIAFANGYPSSYYGTNEVSQWLLYAEMPLSSTAQAVLYPQLQKLIEGRSPAESVDLLCHYVQTAFAYAYDDQQWGADRAFFAEETLYYPYSDCEDRSILLTRLVRDLLQMPCALVYYPGHLATAIAVGPDVKGDHITLHGTKYLICDPTYIGAPIGKTMPGMDNTKAQVLPLPHL